MNKLSDLHKVPLSLLDQIDTAVFISANPPEIEYQNRAFSLITGYTVGEIKDLNTLFDVDAQAQYCLAVKELQNVARTSIALLIQKKAGAKVPVMIELIREHTGENKYSVYGVLHAADNNQWTTKTSQSFYLLAENTSDLVTRHDKDYRYIFVNQEAEKQIGISAAQLIGRSYREIGMPEDICRLWDAHLAEVFDTRTGHDVEFEVPGKTVYVHSRLIPEFDEEGQVSSVLVVSRELSARRRAEEHLIRLASHLQLATESANVGTWLYRVDSGEMEWSALHKKMWGYPETRNDIAFSDWCERIHPDDRERIVQSFRDFLSKRNSYDVEYRVTHESDGAVTWVRSVGKFHSPAQGKELISGVTIDINARKVNEEQLRHGEEQFRATFENAAVGMAHVSTDGRWVRVNNRLCEIVGYTPAELLGLTFQQITYPQDLETDLRFVDQLLEKAVPHYSIEKRYVHKEGHLVWVNLTVSLVRTRDDKPRYFIAVVEDITERKRVEEAVRESNERYKLINKATQDAIWDWNLKTNELVWNEVVYSMFRYDAVQMRPTIDWWYDQIHPEDSERVVHGIHEVIDAGATSWSDHYRFRCGDGTYKIVLDRGFVQHDDNGEAVRMLGSMQDITDQQQFVERLEQNEARFRTLANSISHLAWIADGEGWIFWYNDRWFDYTGTTLEEMQGWGWEKVHHPEHRDRILDFVKDAWKKDEPFELTFPLRAKNGSYRWFLTRAFPIKDTAGNIVQWVGTNTDIHDQKTLAERLEAMVSERTRELQRSNDDLQQFAHVVSHDLKEPVRKITTFGNRLESEVSGMLSERGQTYLRKIMHASDRLTQMIEGTLAYSSVDAKAKDFEEVDLEKVFSDIETDLEVLIQAKGARIVKSDLPVIDGAPLLIYQLFYNLINNSLKFARADVPPLISVRALPAKETHVTVIVSDNGIGFDSVYADKIFNAYIRLNSKDKFEGTGLGLALCKKIVERHHGTISASSVANEGATFTIRLPVSNRSENA